MRATAGRATRLFRVLPTGSRRRVLLEPGTHAGILGTTSSQAYPVADNPPDRSARNVDIVVRANRAWSRRARRLGALGGS